MIEFWHLLKLLIVLTRGVAFTSKVKETGKPLHPKSDGVTVKILDTGTFEKLFAMKELICPVPVEGSPLFVGMLLVQLN
ncbi:MAG: hypothetical protein ACOVOY_11040 [Sediminibacterium sp.]